MFLRCRVSHGIYTVVGKISVELRGLNNRNKVEFVRAILNKLFVLNGLKI